MIYDAGGYSQNAQWDVEYAVHGMDMHGMRKVSLNNFMFQSCLICHCHILFVP